MKSARHLLSVPLALFAFALAAPRPARAEFPAPALYVGLYGGYNLKLTKWDLGNHVDDVNFQPNSSPVAGLRLGFQVIPYLALEGEFGYVPASSTVGGLNHILAWDINAVIQFLGKKNWTPVLELGFGTYSALSGDLGPDTDYRFHIGLGVRGMLTRWLAIRLDVRDVITDGIPSAAGANNLELLLGLDFFAWRGGAAVADRDKDGVPDTQDLCPDKKGSAAHHGCPDTDADGVYDNEDACPTVPGEVALKGCPDKDGDGVVDSEDQCPDVPAGKIADPNKPGCPADTDGDGVLDVDDQCVKVAAGKYPDAKKPGCPADRDNDGVIDERDQCIDVPGGTVQDPDKKGCPADRDADNIPDESDACPDKAGAPDPDKKKNGCPGLVTISGGQIVILQQVYFETNKDKIKSKSFKLLSAVGNAIKTLPAGKRVRVEGHTDNKGKPEKNLELSQKRADAVKKYLIDKEGVKADVLEAKGYGQERPIADNKHSKGRDQNRRVEFHIIESDK